MAAMVLRPTRRKLKQSRSRVRSFSLGAVENASGCTERKKDRQNRPFIGAAKGVPSRGAANRGFGAVQKRGIV
eukprot:1642907-Pyramimonas_sp.AAC.1